jgi:hypothetical protein
MLELAAKLDKVSIHYWDMQSLPYKRKTLDNAFEWVNTHTIEELESLGQDKIRVTLIRTGYKEPIVKDFNSANEADNYLQNSYYTEEYVLKMIWERI